MSYAILLLFSFVLLSRTSGITSNSEKGITDVKNTLVYVDQRSQNFKPIIDDIVTKNNIFKHNRTKIIKDIYSILNNVMLKNQTAEFQSYCLNVIETKLSDRLPPHFMNITLEKAFEDLLSNITVFHQSIEKRLENVKKEFNPFLADSSLLFARYHEENQCLLEYKALKEGELIQAQLNLLERDVNEILELIKERFLELQSGLANAYIIIQQTSRTIPSTKKRSRTKREDYKQ